MDRLKLAALGERLKIGGERLKVGGAEMGRKVGGKMKEILQGQSQEAKMVDEATSDTLAEPNWSLNLRICGLLNRDEFNGSEVVKAIKKKIAGKNVVSQKLSLDLLEACAMNCDKVFSEVASEKLLEEMVRMIDNPQTDHANRRRAFQLIEAWGKSDDLAYLPVFRQIYQSLKTRKVPDTVKDNGNSSFTPQIYEQEAAIRERYPYSSIDQHDSDLHDFAFHSEIPSVEERKEILVTTQNSMDILSSILNSGTHQKPIEDELTLSLLEKCKEAQPVLQRIIETTMDDEPLLFEALSLHDELQQIISKVEEFDVSGLQPDECTPTEPITLSNQVDCPLDEKEAGPRPQAERPTSGGKIGESINEKV